MRSWALVCSSRLRMVRVAMGSAPTDLKVAHPRADFDTTADTEARLQQLEGLRADPKKVRTE